MGDGQILRDLLDNFRSQQRDILERVWTQGNTLSAWLILGNAGGLVLLAQLRGQASLCAPDVVHSAAQWFAVGLVSTFVGLAVGYIGSWISLIWLGKIGNRLQNAWISQYFVDQLKHEGIDVADDSDLARDVSDQISEMQAFAPRLKRLYIFVAIAMAFMVGGGVAFALGLAGPLLSGEPFATCLDVSGTLTIPNASLTATGK